MLLVSIVRTIMFVLQVMIMGYPCGMIKFDVEKLFHKRKVISIYIKLRLCLNSESRNDIYIEFYSYYKINWES